MHLESERGKSFRSVSLGESVQVLAHVHPLRTMHGLLCR